MNFMRFHLIASAIFIQLLVAGSLQASPAQPTLFVHVNIVPMDKERVLKDQSVLVQDGAIAAIGSALPAPAGAKKQGHHELTVFLRQPTQQQLDAAVRDAWAAMRARGRQRDPK